MKNKMKMLTFLLSGVSIETASVSTKITLILFVMLGTINYMHAQQQFQKSYGIGNSENGYAIEQTPDGGYLVAGHNNYSSISYSAGMLLKLDANGDTVWTRLYDTPAYDHFESGIRTSDGGYIATGPTGFVFGSTDIYVVKTNSAGGITWSKTYGGSNVDETYKVIETSDGNFLIVGFTGSYGPGGGDIYLLKLNTSGDTLWTSAIGTTASENVKDVFETSTGGFILTGHFTDPSVSADIDMTVVYVNAGGNIAGIQTIGGGGSEVAMDMAEVIEPTSDGGFIVGGRSNNWGVSDFILVKFDSTTAIQWAKNYGANINEYIFDIEQTPDGGYIFVGSSTSIIPNTIMAIAVRTDAAGDTLWTRAYHWSFETEFYAVDNTTDGGFVFCGFIKQGGSPGNNNIYVVKTDANGNSGCNEFATTLAVTSITPTIGNLSPTVARGSLVQNNTDITGGGLSVNTYCINTGIDERHSGEEAISVHPNPARNELAIGNRQKAIENIEIYNTLGEKVYDNAEGFQSNAETINVSKLTSGIYFVRVKTGEGMSSGKFVKE